MYGGEGIARGGGVAAALLGLLLLHSAAPAAQITVDSWKVRLLSANARDGGERTQILDRLVPFDLVALQEVKDDAIIAILVDSLNARGLPCAAQQSPALGIPPNACSPATAARHAAARPAASTRVGRRVPASPDSVSETVTWRWDPMTVGRNDPCPCGSGKKYKKCCLLADQARSDPLTLRLINRSSEEAFRLLLTHARRTRGELFLEEVWRAVWAGQRSFVQGDPFGQLVMPWGVYLWDAGQGSVAADFLRAPAARHLEGRTRAFIHACRSEPLTFWQAQAVEPGAGMALRDLATGRECFVHERSATQTIVAGDLVFGQVVAIDGIHTLSMSGPYALPAAGFRERVEWFLAEKVDPAGLVDRSDDLLHFYLACVDELLHPRLPELCNTDGDPVEWTTSTYRFAPEQRGRLLGRLDQMRYIEASPVEGEDKAEFVWVSPRHGGPLEHVTRGRLEVGTESLVTECNSRKRDRLLRDRLTKHLGDLVVRESTTHMPLDGDALTAAAAQPAAGGAIDPSTLPPEVREQMQRFLDDIHLHWADESVPALGGRTPREASQTPEGRRAVADLLNDFENRQRRDRDARDTFDYNRLRRELGIELE
ncbi:MAG: SEC-C metal-binding domain-containing protein [Candidatus Latescibacterota bacterium]